ncbi:MAG: hypothetical protein N2255_02815, partial [Kiritimatiellae bacterium]|nr:hypothetical protein [Kiritimatiellia bacterium]
RGLGDVYKRQDLHNPQICKLLRGHGRILGVDVRGFGQSLPQGCDCREFLAPYDCDYFFDAYGLMLGEPYLGRRVYDLLRIIDWLRDWGYKRIRLAGRGLGALTALLAAVIEPKLESVLLMNCLLSLADLLETPIYRWPASARVPGMLCFFDLPDCYRCLGPKLTLITPWDAQMKPLRSLVARQRLKELDLGEIRLSAM